MAQSPVKLTSSDSLDDYLKNWDALSSMLTRGRSFSGRERNCAFLNLGSSGGTLHRFADISADSGLVFIDDGRAVIATDWDHDGDLDLWQTNREGPRLRFVKNQLAHRSQWVAFKLTGTTCNRDAIGAVLELRTAARKITRTLTAGDGFMSQAGKYLHFGLGPSPGALLSVTVRWPGKTAETFDRITAGSTYHLVQGSASAQKITFAKDKIDLPEDTPELPAPTEQARILLSQRIATPSFEYVDFQGQIQKYDPSTDGEKRAILINLWASWCPNCCDELSDLKINHQKLQAKGLDILALAIEGISPKGGKVDLSGAKELVATSSFPLRVGAAGQNTLRLLTVLQNQLISRQRPLPLPSSFLIDRDGRLTALYKGPVSAKQLLADLDLLEADQKTIEAQVFPFPGKTGRNLFGQGALDFARAHLAGGDPDAARRLATKLTEAPMTNKAKGDLATRAQAWYFLGTLEQGLRNWKAAAEAYQNALDFSPEQLALQIPLGVSLWQAGSHEEARKIFKDTATRGQKDPVIMNALGKAHLQIKLYQEAVHYLEKALAIAPQQLRYQQTLALAYQTGGPSTKAVELYEKLLKANPTSANAKNNLALILATAPEDEVRDGDKALALAREVISQAGEGHPAPLDSLAAALAETGDFEGAVQAIRKALDAARAIGRDDLLPKFQAKWDLYQAQKPYRLTRQ